MAGPGRVGFDTRLRAMSTSVTIAKSHRATWPVDVSTNGGFLERDESRNGQGVQVSRTLWVWSQNRPVPRPE